MSDWRSCDNCSVQCSRRIANVCGCWKSIPCKRCGGPLSEIREHNGKRYRHCYACHAEFFEEDL